MEAAGQGGWGGGVGRGGHGGAERREPAGEGEASLDENMVEHSDLS